jgi:hypothetical protein
MAAELKGDDVGRWWADAHLYREEGGNVVKLACYYGDLVSMALVLLVLLSRVPRFGRG